ncbi:MAG: AAA family ATPase [Candidatus Promineifilaceae bacterium]
MRGFKFLLLLSLFALGFGLTTSPQASAQSPSVPSYWQFNPSDPLDAIVAFDFAQAGGAGFAFVSAGNQLTLIGVNGIPLWAEPLVFETPIRAIASTTDAIVVATDRLLQQVDASRTVREEAIVELSAPVVRLVSQPLPNGSTGVLAQFEGGTLHQYDALGEQKWHYVPIDASSAEIAREIIIADVNRDGLSEIIYSYRAGSGFSRVDLLEANGRSRWSEAFDRAITAVGVGRFSADSPSLIAVGNNRGALSLLNMDKASVWTPRTLNRPISDLLFAEWHTDDNLLIVATEVGKLIAYDATGRRAWDKAVCWENATFILQDVACTDGVTVSIRELDAPQTRQAIVALTLLVDNGENQFLLLLDHAHNIVDQYQTTHVQQQPLLIDINKDNISELARVTDTSFALLSTQTVARSTQALVEQGYALDAKPSAFLAHELDQAAVDALIIGGEDGRLHRIHSADRSDDWIITKSGYQVVHIDYVDPAALPSGRNLSQPAGKRDGGYLIVAYNKSAENVSDDPFSQVELYKNNGRAGWAEPLIFNSPIQKMLVSQTSNLAPTLVFGLANGRMLGYILETDGEENTIWQHTEEMMWSAFVGDSVSSLTLLKHPSKLSPHIVVATRRELRLYDLSGAFRETFGVGEKEGACQSAVDILTLISASAIGEQPCLKGTRLKDWIAQLGVGVTDRPVVQTAIYTYRPLNTKSWQRSTTQTFNDGQDRITPGSGPTLIQNVQASYAGDIMGLGQTDFVLAKADGTVQIELSNSAESTLTLKKPVYGITALRRPASESANLVIIDENGNVSSFQFLPNYPPLLSQPIVTNNETQYLIQLSILDIESQPIQTTLEVFNPQTAGWEFVSTQETIGNLSSIEWALAPPTHDEPVRYRIQYQDGNNPSYLFEPADGPVAIRPSAPEQSVAGTWITFFFGVVVCCLGGIFIWQQPASQARRFYRRLKRTSATTLVQLHEHYNDQEQEAQLFVNLATIARQQGDEFIASLADGLYLLGDRPAPGLQILNAVLAEHRPQHTVFQLGEWRLMCRAASDLMQAASTAELSLLRPKLDQLLALRDQHNNLNGVYPRLMPSFNSLADSTRVTTPEDRLAFLNDANSLLQRLNSENKRAAVYLSRVLVSAIAEHWQTLVATEIEMLRGRARLEARLMTARIAPSEMSQITLEITNLGRATAEDVQITMLHDKITATNGATQHIQSLAPSAKRQVHFEISVPPQEHFRLAFRIVYSDRQRTAQAFEYANLVTVLTPNKDFAPIKNPYSPGTPLRPDSALFFGRMPLFNFIAQEAERASQQHVLILVGQRRTGKTSALLRLNRHLPDHLIPIYIDCQSLGVLPGMTAFFQDIAWLISDVLLEYDLDIEVPDLDTLNQNPGNWFQHQFIPSVREQLLPTTKLVLVFDEFEAFENLTTDNILPRTIFSYLRHLMQHGEGLSFIFVGTHKLEEMTTDYWSVLFNIALYQSIDFLDRRAALDLLTKPVEPNLIYDDLAINKIWRLTAGHPYFLQLVCYSLVKRANEQKTSYVTISDVNETVSEMLGLGEVHFAYIWQRSTSAERAALIAIAHLIDKELPFRTLAIVEALQPYKTTLTPTQITAALEKLVQRNIMTVAHDGVQTQYELKVGLVGAWIEQSKSMSRLIRGM